MKNSMALFLCVLGCILLIISAYLVRKETKALHIILVGGVVTIVAGLVTTVGTFIQNSNNNIRNTRIDTGVQKAVQTGDKLFDQVTGGESYCLVDIMFDEIKHLPIFYIRSIGLQPLNNVSVTINDLGRRNYLLQRQPDPAYFDEIANATVIKYSFGTIRQEDEHHYIQIPFEKGQKDIELNISFHLDNGRIEETLKVENFRDSAPVQMQVKRGDTILVKDYNALHGL